MHPLLILICVGSVHQGFRNHNWLGVFEIPVFVYTPRPHRNPLRMVEPVGCWVGDGTSQIPPVIYPS